MLIIKPWRPHRLVDSMPPFPKLTITFVHEGLLTSSQKIVIFSLTPYIILKAFSFFSTL